MSEHQGLQSELIIAVDGSPLEASVMEYLIDAVVEDDLAQPAMFVLRFHDPEFTLTDGASFNPGKEVKVSVKNRKNATKVLLIGEVTSLEAEFSQYERTLVVRGYDRSHRLYRGRKTRTFLNQTDSAMASQIAQEAGFSAQVTATTTQHAYVMQDNQTDMEFLRDRAARVGYQVLADGQKLKFVDADEAPPAAPAQEWGVTLHSFHARLSAVAQPNTVKVQGWDPKLKQAIVGTASTPSAPSSIGYGKTGGQAAQSAFGSAATVVISDVPIGTQAEATALAQATLDRMAGDHLAAEGQCLGEPGIKAGTTVQ
ncbi:MAG TPA: contractile injection system protein, VgrG/Pvc8 family, partial [Herpetosiphonaceae bacterium]|nr:contractile injection system protein, VgrG/Pvc8 family [Herpetosiphonaceae bacterium]